MSLSVNRFSFPRNQLLRRFNRRINTGEISVKSSVRPDTISADDSNFSRFFIFYIYLYYTHIVKLHDILYTICNSTLTFSNIYTLNIGETPGDILKLAQINDFPLMRKLTLRNLPSPQKEKKKYYDLNFKPKEKKMTEAHRTCCATHTKIIDLSTSRPIHHDKYGRTSRSGFNKQLFNTSLLIRLEYIVSEYIFSVSLLHCSLFVM